MQDRVQEVIRRRTQAAMQVRAHMIPASVQLVMYRRIPPKVTVRAHTTHRRQDNHQATRPLNRPRNRPTRPVARIQMIGSSEVDAATDNDTFPYKTPAGTVFECD
jgi:hypothetical protein